MAKRKTSLGNALDHEAKDTTAELGSGRWRSASEPTSASPKPRLFRSVREAMEHEAAEEEALRQRNVVLEMASTLDARTLSSLEQEQADEAGYTVIRRRAVSDLTGTQQRIAHFESRISHSRARGQGTRQQPRANKRSDTSTGGGSGSRSSVASASASTTSSGRRKAKRSPQSQSTPNTSRFRTKTEPTTPDASCPVDDDASDQQLWLAAASAGAVQPAKSPQTASPETAAAAWGVSSVWSPATSTMVEDVQTRETASSQLPPAASHDELQEKAADLDESMFSWLERALSLDETRASSPPPPTATAVASPSPRIA